MTTVDRRALAWLPASVAADNTLTHRHRSGVVMFADVSGFTALTEHLRRTQGKRGIEQLTQRLNTIFTDMVQSVHRCHGEVLKFGGDALLIAFESTTALHDAITCTSLLHACVRRHSPRARSVQLGLHVGMAHGEWHERIVGVRGQRCEHIIYGDAVRRAIDEADAASDGQTLLHASAKTIDELMADEKPQRLSKNRYSVPLRRTKASDTDLGNQASDISKTDLPWDFVPLALRDILRTPAIDPLAFGEHRRVSTVFVFWQAPPSAFHSDSFWKNLFDVVHTCSLEHNGLWARSDPAGPYHKLLILFGTPRSSDDDTDRAMAFAASLRDGLSRIADRVRGFHFGIGVVAQTVFSGFVGAPDRFEFTAMGDGVNLAARLAAKAGQHGILIDDGTRTSCPAWTCAPQGSLSLKGVTDPVPVFTPAERVANHPETMIHDDVVEHPQAFDEAVRFWQSHDSEPLIIASEPEADVHRFVLQVMNQVSPPGGVNRHVTFAPQDAQQPHAGLRRLLQTLCEANSSGELQPHDVCHRSHHDVTTWSVVLGNEAKLQRHLATRGVDLWTMEVVEALTRLPQVTALAQRQAVLMLESVHHLSSIDSQIIESFWKRIAPTMRVMVSREVRPANAQSSAIHLGPVTKDEMRSVLAASVADEAVSSRLLDVLQVKSHGFARLARLFLNDLIQRGHLQPPGSGNATWRLGDLSSVELPDSLRAHYIQQLDRLPHAEKTVARIVSVLGDGSPPAAVQCVADHQNGQCDIDNTLRSLQRQDLIAIDAGPEPSIRFATPMCRQAAYETMSFSEREALHELAARFWRNRGARNASITGRHLFFARRFDDALPLLTQAAERSCRLWLLEEAQVLYRYCVLAASGKGDTDTARVVPPVSKQVIHAHEEIIAAFADILRERGLYRESGFLFGRLARPDTNLPRADRLRYRLAHARVDWLAGHYARCERTINRIMRGARGASHDALISEATVLLAEVMRRTGRLTRADRLLKRASKRLQKSSDEKLRADALNTHGLVSWALGRIDEARQHFQAALALMRSQRNAARRGQLANNLGILFEETGQLSKAESYYDRAFRTFDRIGHRRNRAYCLGNLSNLYRHAARYEQARAAYEETEFELRTIGEQHAAAYTIGNLGDLARDFGDWLRARTLYEQTLEYAQSSKDIELRAECYARLAEFDIVNGSLDAARSLLDRAGRDAEAVGSREFRLRVECLRGDVAIRRGQFDDACRQYRHALDTAEQSGLVLYRLIATVGLARSHMELGGVTEALQSACSAASLAKRSRYRWLELNALVTAAEADCSQQNYATRKRRVDCLHRADMVRNDIRGSIGDEAVRTTFDSLPVVKRLSRLIGERHHMADREFV
ncbi:MAG: tetratricopeptide repeat protein [candidate division Zixibacteria bacterium]|nr:tetratricopeptide repeat protein [candidate division Zixibacteria bacterium]